MNTEHKRALLAMEPEELSKILWARANSRNSPLSTEESELLDQCYNLAIARSWANPQTNG